MELRRHKEVLHLTLQQLPTINLHSRNHILGTKRKNDHPQNLDDFAVNMNSQNPGFSMIITIDHIGKPTPMPIKERYDLQSLCMTIFHSDIDALPNLTARGV